MPELLKADAATLRYNSSDMPNDPLSVAVVKHLTTPVLRTRDHVLGPDEAPITLLEYGDYECPDCGRAYPMLKQLQSRFPNRLAFAFRHFPLFTVHRHASVAAQAAEAAGAQGKFWPMHDLLYQHQDSLEVPDFTHHALKLGLELYRFEAALSTQAFLHRVEEDFSSGQASGVRGTPTLFINDIPYEGEVELGAIASAIESALSRAI